MLRLDSADMLKRLGFALNYALNRDIAGRTAMRFPDDIFLVAYPGSGGQWLRTLLANLLNSNSAVTASDVCYRIPSLYEVPRRTLVKTRRPRIIFSHECFDSDCRAQVIYLIRDPRDVAVSLYKHQVRASSAEAGSLEEFVATTFMTTDQHQGGWAEDFSARISEDRGFFYSMRLREKFLGTPASWGENVMSWFGAGASYASALLKIRYEDLFSDGETVLASISECLNVGRSSAEIREAMRVSYASANELLPEKPGEWKSALSAASVRRIESTWGSVMCSFGYQLSEPMDAR